MAEAVPITTIPIRTFQVEDHEGVIQAVIQAVAVFPHRRRMVTGSGPTLRLWDLKKVIVLKEMEGHRSDVRAVAVSRDGRLIASGDQEGKLIAWHGKTGESLIASESFVEGKSLTQSYEWIDAHSKCICSLDFSPDGSMMASGSFDQTTKLWSTKTWKVQGDLIRCSDVVCCVRYSPSGEFLAIATDLDIAIYDPSTRESVANFKGSSSNVSLVWTPGSTRLLSAGDHRDPAIREWDTSTWMQIGDPWTGHTEGITAVAINFGGTMIASASRDNHVRLWQLSDRRTIAIFNHSDSMNCVTFSMDGKHILSGGNDKKVSEWRVGVHRALLIAVEKVAGFPNLPQAHMDALRMRDFLVKSRDYQPENIIIMMHHHSIAPRLYPSRTNMLREIDLVVRCTSQHDHLFFYYTGQGDQVTCRHNSEADGKDEAILTYTGKRIIDNVLKKRLVDPLPQGAKLFALWDCCHSHTVLDLRHYDCNELWRAPFKVLFERENRKLWQVNPITVRYYLNVRRAGEFNASLLRDSCEVQSSMNDDSQTDNMGLGSRVSSPETYLPKCTVDCPPTLPEERLKADVVRVSLLFKSSSKSEVDHPKVSLSACRDNELAYDNNTTGETFTKFFIEYLERNPEASYHDLLSYIRHKVDKITLGRTRVTRDTSDHPLRRLSQNEVEIDDQREHSHTENDTSTLNSQRPSYSSHNRLDMLQIIDL
ncbi:WD40-repeat-containing domain protein [Suillus lakei]|nr:WD40-repeat-containing domain protein [Suillus lakei]